MNKHILTLFTSDNLFKEDKMIKLIIGSIFIMGAMLLSMSDFISIGEQLIATLLAMIYVVINE